MFEITADDIALLSDEDLRSLVGLLCEAELRRRTLPVSAVTWGGNQNANDGGVDVRVALPPTTAIDDFIPRYTTVFQVKKQEMPRAEILAEMSPKGVLRPIIHELANQAGAYIIVSSEDTTSDTMLNSRRDAMTEALKDAVNKESLAIDFYDRGRLATWVRGHVGVILWVKGKIGRPTRGWSAYDAWAYPPEGLEPAYLVDPALRVRTARHGDEAGLSVSDSIQRLRESLRQPGSIVRLVGLSGVGKTRLVQALFDDRVGENPLNVSLAVYTNLSSDPDPQPDGMVADLVLTSTPAIIVIDNCSSALHQRLSELCRRPESRASLVTIEYDISDDQQEGTAVYSLDPSSKELIEELVARRFPHVSVVDVSTVAEFSGGNARIAIALAATIGEHETIAGLGDTELFRRLFDQRQQPDESLYLAAQACALVYSFQGDDVSTSNHAELARLGALVDQTPTALFRRVAELARRDLVQKRGIWRAVLPHALANRLATAALKNIPGTIIDAQLVTGAPDRLRKSFSRRLGYLDASPEARKLVQRWLDVGGILGDAATLDEAGRAMFENIASVLPDATLATLERAFLGVENDKASAHGAEYVHLLRSLAYDAPLFERCMTLLTKIALAGDLDDRSNHPLDVFTSLFHLYLSGTQASIEQRMKIVATLLTSSDPRAQQLGGKALSSALEANHFTSMFNFDFGARSRDYGYQPRTAGDLRHWFGAVLTLAQTIACSTDLLAGQVRGVVAEKFHGLWTGSNAQEELDQFCRRVAENAPWPEGWLAVRETFGLIETGTDSRERLLALEKALRPSTLIQRVRSIVLIQRWNPTDFEEIPDVDSDDLAGQHARTDALAQQLGKEVAADETVFSALLPEIVRTEGRLWLFGQGLAEGTPNHQVLWDRLINELALTDPARRRLDVLNGFLQQVHRNNPTLANTWLDDAVTGDILGLYYPVLQAVIGLDVRGIDRVKQSLTVGIAPIGMYQNLSHGRVTDMLPGPVLRDLLNEIATKDGGHAVVINILARRIHSDRQSVPVEVINFGKELIGQLTFTKDEGPDHDLGNIAAACLAGDDAAAVVEEVCRRLQIAVAKHRTHGFNHQQLLKALFRTHPLHALNGLCNGDADDQERGLRVIDDIRRHRHNPLDDIPEIKLINWCDQDPRMRYPLVASAITISQQNPNESPQWSHLALQLLEKAPDRVAVLKRLTQQFTPILGWTGSLAAILESNAKLLVLKELTEHSDPQVVEFAKDATLRLAEHIAIQRRNENNTNKDLNERFE